MNFNLLTLPLDLLQWPAMVTTVAAAWLIAARTSWQRTAGFWLFLASNLLWGVWGWHVHAYALVGLQVMLAVLNVRGVWNSAEVEDESRSWPERRNQRGKLHTHSRTSPRCRLIPLTPITAERPQSAAP